MEKTGAAGIFSVVKSSAGASSVMGAGLSSIGKQRAGTYSIIRAATFSIGAGTFKLSVKGPSRSENGAGSFSIVIGSEADASDLRKR